MWMVVLMVWVHDDMGQCVVWMLGLCVDGSAHGVGAWCMSLYGYFSMLFN